jgi:hypothetical protein
MTNILFTFLSVLLFIAILFPTYTASAQTLKLEKPELFIKLDSTC